MPVAYVHPLTAYRAKHGLTMQELGEKCVPRIPKSTMSRIESGARKPSFQQLQALREACGGEVTSDDIIQATPRQVAA